MREGWELVGATYQEDEAVLELLEAIDVLCRCPPCGGGGGEEAVSHRLSQGTNPLPWPSALTPRTRVLFLPLFLRLLRTGIDLGLHQRLHEHLDVPQDVVQHLLDTKSLGLRRAIMPPLEPPTCPSPCLCPRPPPPAPPSLLSPRPALATLGPGFWGEGLVSPFARLRSSADPGSLRLPGPSLGPRGSGGALEEAERRRLVLGHWSVVTGAVGMVARLQCKRAWLLIFNLNLFSPVPTPHTYCALGSSRGVVLVGAPTPGELPAP